MIISVPALKAGDGNESEMVYNNTFIDEHFVAGDGNESEMVYNNTFIDEHFVQDSALVLINGVVISAVLEAFCSRGIGALPVDHQAGFCQGFGPEATTFLYLAKSQWPKDALEIWSSLNMILFGGTMAGIEQLLSRNPFSPVRRAVPFMMYYQATRIRAEAVDRYVTGSNQSFSSDYMMSNGISTGLITGGLSLYIQTGQYKPLVLLMVTPGVTMMSIFFYDLVNSEIDFSELATAGARAMILVVVTVVAGTVVGYAAEDVALAVAAVGAGVGAGAEAGAAGDGTLAAVLTGVIVVRLSRHSGAFPIVRGGIIMTIATGLPLMVSSWGASWARFVASNVTAHETMQSEFIFPLNKFGAFFSDSWIYKLLYWE